MVFLRFDFCFEVVEEGFFFGYVGVEEVGMFGGELLVSCCYGFVVY